MRMSPAGPGGTGGMLATPIVAQSFACLPLSFMDGCRFFLANELILQIPWLVRLALKTLFFFR